MTLTALGLGDSEAFPEIKKKDKTGFYGTKKVNKVLGGEGKEHEKICGGESKLNKFTKGNGWGFSDGTQLQSGMWTRGGG